MPTSNYYAAANQTWPIFCKQFCLSFIHHFFVLQDKNMSSGLLFFTLNQAQKYSPTEFITMFQNIHSASNSIQSPFQLHQFCSSQPKKHLQALLLHALSRKNTRTLQIQKTEQAINVFHKYLQTRSILYNDFVAQVIPHLNFDSNVDFM